MADAVLRLFCSQRSELSGCVAGESKGSKENCCQKMMRVGIRAKILIIFATTLIITSALNLFFIGHILKKDYTSVLHSELLVLGNNLQTQLKRITSLGISTRNIEGFGQQCRELVEKNERVVQAMVIDATGTIIFHNDSSYQGKKLAQKNILSSITAGRTEIYSVKENKGSTYFAVLPFGNSADYHEYAIVICSPAKIINDKVFTLINRCNIVLLSGFGLAALLLLVGLTTMLTSPLAAIAKTMEDVTKSRNLERRVDIKSHDEIGQIADAFNKMTTDLQQSTTSIDNLNHEIAERKRAESKLQLTQFSIDNALDCAFRIEPNGRISYVNNAACEIFGYSRDEMLSLSAWDIDPNFSEETSHKSWQEIKQKGSMDFESISKTKDGRFFPVEVSAFYVDFEGYECVWAFSRDISERKKAEHELKNTIAKLGRANDELKNFVYIASHDLREPMRKISSFGELLSASLKGKLDRDNEENLGFMIDGAKRMQQMIDALLTYSRITTRGVDFEPVDLNKVVEELCDIELAIKIEETGAKIATPERLHNVNCDPTQIRQLMQNLIANSLTYHKKGVAPEITIRSSVVDNDMIRVEVADNGIGIKQEQFENIFVMFRRLHSRQEYEGAGIGLAICKKIVERHRGDIGVSSTHGQGSTFWFTMPAASKTPAEEQIGLVSSSKAGFEKQLDR